MGAQAMNEKALASAIFVFSIRLLNELEKHESVVSSPLSAEFVLALLTLGTTDPAHRELLAALGFEDDKAIRSTFSSLTTKLKSIKGVHLDVANKLYLRQGLQLDDQMRNDSLKLFDTEIEEMNFADGSAAAQRINKWAEAKTNHKINDIISSGSIHDNTQLILINAIYFKGTWSKPFNPEFTSYGPFHMDSKTTVTVPMMINLDSKYRYGTSDTLEAELLLMPYEGGKANMVFILPYEVEGLSEVLTKLADEYDLIEKIDTLEETRVDVTIPKFKIETEIELDVVLPRLGIKSIFNTGVDKMLKNNMTVPVSVAIQKAFIEVNEEGTEAAAVTAEFVTLSQPPQFTANRPFLYVITGPGRVTLFLGAYRGDVFK